MLRIATRGSPLALWQARAVGDGLRLAHPGVEVALVVVSTRGDRSAEVPVWEMGGQGVFVKEVQAAVLDGRADLAVHSAKDLPSEPTPGLGITCVPPRGDARDALVGSTLHRLAPGATVATGSVRRRAQLAWLRPDLTFTGVRGTIATRLRQVPAGGVLVVAAAALARLDMSDLTAEALAPEVLLPQVGQGALAVECRVGDDITAAALMPLDHRPSHLALDAERAFLARLGSGCSLPVGAQATVEGTALRLDGLIASIDGRVLLRDHRVGHTDDPAATGDDLADALLHGAGGHTVLDADGTQSAREVPSAAL